MNCIHGLNKHIQIGKIIMNGHEDLNQWVSSAGSADPMHLLLSRDSPVYRFLYQRHHGKVFHPDQLQELNTDMDVIHKSFYEQEKELYLQSVAPPPPYEEGILHDLQQATVIPVMVRQGISIEEFGLTLTLKTPQGQLHVFHYARFTVEMENGQPVIKVMFEQ